MFWCRVTEAPRTVSITLEKRTSMVVAGRSTFPPFVVFGKQAFHFIEISFVPFVLGDHLLNSLGTQIKGSDFRGI